MLAHFSCVSPTLNLRNISHICTRAMLHVSRHYLQYTSNVYTLYATCMYVIGDPVASYPLGTCSVLSYLTPTSTPHFAPLLHFPPPSSPFHLPLPLLPLLSLLSPLSTLLLLDAAERGHCSCYDSGRPWTGSAWSTPKTRVK